jgi:hypothetical protein
MINGNPRSVRRLMALRLGPLMAPAVQAPWIDRGLALHLAGEMGYSDHRCDASASDASRGCAGIWHARRLSAPRHSGRHHRDRRKRRDTRIPSWGLGHCCHLALEPQSRPSRHGSVSAPGVSINTGQPAGSLPTRSQRNPGHDRSAARPSDRAPAAVGSHRRHRACAGVPGRAPR